MAELSYPSPAVTQVQHERLMGGSAASGVFGHPNDPAVVYAPNSGTREVRVRASRRAIVEGYGWENDTSEIVKNLAANSSGSTRVDLVVLRLNRATWTVTVQVVQGTPGAGAPAPTLGTGSSGVWELPLAEVTVASGATTLASSTVTNRAWYIGSDGQYRCTPTTRPPHEAGRAAWDIEAGWILSTGGTWLVAAEDTQGLITPTGGTGGYQISPDPLHRRNGWCQFRLTFWRTSLAMTANTEYRVGMVPVGFRPATHAPSFGMCPSIQSLVTYSVTPAGEILVNPGGTQIPANRAVTLAAQSYPVA